MEQQLEELDNYNSDNAGINMVPAVKMTVLLLEPSTSSGYVFSHEENDVLLQRFGNMIKGSSPILLEEIKKKLEGYDLLKKYGAWKVQNRIKYERYKYRQRKQK